MPTEIRAHLVTFAGKTSLELRVYEPHPKRGMAPTPRHIRIPADQMLAVAELILRANDVVRDGLVGDGEGR